MKPNPHHQINLKLAPKLFLIMFGILSFNWIVLYLNLLRVMLMSNMGTFKFGDKCLKLFPQGMTTTGHRLGITLNRRLAGAVAYIKVNG